jgi:hypothetical protein
VLHVNIRFVRSCFITVYTKLPTAFFDHTKKKKNHTVSNSEGPEYPVVRIICSTSQNGHVTCTGCSDRELPGSSLESGTESAPIHTYATLHNETEKGLNCGNRM